MEYTINGKLEEHDYRIFNFEYLKHKYKKPLYFTLHIITSIILISLIIFDIININRTSYPFFGSMAFNILLFICICIIWFIISLNYKIRKQFSTNEFNKDITNYVINENSINYFSQNSSLSIVKDKIYEILYSKNAIYIFISSDSACIIPARFFGSATEYENCKLFIKKHYSRIT